MSRGELLTAYTELMDKLDRARAEVVTLELALRQLSDAHRDALAAIKAILPSPAAPTKAPRKPRSDKNKSRTRRVEGVQTQAAIDLQAPLATAA
jgi:hypothetical protein